MGRLRFDPLLELVTNVGLAVGLLWLGLTALTVALLILMWTRWGQSRPLQKCLALSILAHLLLAGYSATVTIVSSVPARAEEPPIQVSLTEEEIERRFGLSSPTTQPDPWDSFAHQPLPEPEPITLARAEPAEMPQPQREPQTEPRGISDHPPLAPLTLAEAVPPDPDSLPDDLPVTASASSGKAPETIEAPAAERREGARIEVPQSPEPQRRLAQADTPESPSERSVRPGLPSELLERPLPMPRLANLPATPEPAPSLVGVSDSLTRGSQGTPADYSSPQTPQAGTRADAASMPLARRTAPDANPLKPPSIAARTSAGSPDAGNLDSTPARAEAIRSAMLPVNRPETIQTRVPAEYRLRVAPERSRLAELHGATAETETAVKLALAWLADNQAPDGHWDARAHGAGRETYVAGRDRQGAGARADTGLTGLALLAFLASGHTHRDGSYAATVARGIDYLLRIQGQDGNLGGQAATYELMYCHAMAACALSEAYAMTGDVRLRAPVERAIRYTISAQDPSGGGWRYKPGDAGDTSQLGWQLMALRSAELAGLPIPESCRQGARRYLRSASSGQYGGLAAYRPVEQASRPMTAEALVCRLFLGTPPTDPAVAEAADYILAELPGQGRNNVYYWYYATLGMYYLQGERWDRWNAALQRRLVESQRKHPPHIGSWDPDEVWGQYGGRVYSTAMAALCLEVYYRFLPLYVGAATPGHLLR